MWARQKFRVMSDIKDCDSLSIISLASLKYFAELEREGIFHGDIKPANIFFKGHLVSADSGSLLYLDNKIDDNQKAYLI